MIHSLLTPQFLGNLTLNISLGAYLIWFLPQVILNFKRKNTDGLSLGMHGILLLGYLCDLLYGFGRSMEWQYRLVTIMGLCCLALQHYQFFRYGQHTRQQKVAYRYLNVVYLVLLVYAVLAISKLTYSASFYVFAGLLANSCWLIYMLPQVLTNFQNKSTEGLSILFVLIGAFLNLCDLNTAWLLHWDYPSKLGPAIGFLVKIVVLIQIYYYAKQQRTPGERLVASC